MESSAPHSASGSSFAQNAQNPPKRRGVDLVVDAHAVPGAEFDFDDAGLVRRLLRSLGATVSPRPIRTAPPSPRSRPEAKTAHPAGSAVRASLRL